MEQKDLENKSVEELVNTLLDKDIYETAHAYDNFRKYAILRFRCYEECVKYMLGNARLSELEDQKRTPAFDDKVRFLFYATMMQMDSSLKDDLRKIDARQNFINNVGNLISGAYERFKERPERENESVRFLIVHIILDMCFAYVDKERVVSRLQLPAMFYDLMCRWNREESSPEDFRKFYGEAAEQDILNRTWENVKLYCQEKYIDPGEWSRSQFVQEKEYVRRFGEKLMQIAGSDGDVMRADTVQPRGAVQAESTAQPRGAVQTESTVQPRGAVQAESTAQPREAVRPESSVRSEGTMQSPYTMQAENGMQQENTPDSEEQFWQGGKKEDTYVNEAAVADWLSREKNKAEKSPTDDLLNDPTDDPTITPEYDSERNQKRSRKEDSKPKEKGFSRKGVFITLVVVGVFLIIIAWFVFGGATMTGSSGRERAKLNYTNTISAPLLLWDDADEEAQKGDTYEYFSRN